MLHQGKLKTLPYAVLSMLLFVAGEGFCADTTRVFFFGHSLLSSGGVGRPTEFRAWAAEQGKPMVTKIMNSGDNYIGNIRVGWNHDTLKKTIGNGNWDYVIYDKGDGSGNIPLDSYYIYHQLIADTIRHSGAVPIIYDTWHHDVEADVFEAARRAGSYVAPVWYAYNWCLSRYPDIHYKVDWAHAAEPLGYLAGCVCWATTFKQKPFGFSKVYADLSAEEAHLMQQTAWNTCTHPSYLPYMTWAVRPALVKAVTFTKSPDSLELFRSRQLLVRTVFDNDSVEASSKWAIFQSLTPDIISVSHSGVATAMRLGTGRVVAIREQKSDTLSITIKPTTLILDSIRILPQVPSSYLSDGFQFSAIGFFRDSAIRDTMEITPNAAWISSDTSVFTIQEGKIQRTSARGGTVLFVAAELNGKKDTVRFTMIPEFSYLTRINFQDGDTVFHPEWKPDWGRTYSDSLGYGWIGVRRFFRKTNTQAITYYDSNFLRFSYVVPQDSADLPVYGRFKLNARDGDYIIKVAVGSYYRYNINCAVIFEKKTLDSAAPYLDTVVSYVPTDAQRMKIVKDTLRVFGEGGINLRVYGPIAYLVVCSMEGVDIDSVALDGDEYIRGSAAQSGLLPSGNDPLLAAYPNPFNPSTRISFSLGKRERVSVMVMNTAGQTVRKLCSGMHDAGSHVLDWNGRDNEGRPVSAGLYAVRFTGGRRSMTLRVLLVK